MSIHLESDVLSYLCGPQLVQQLECALSIYRIRPVLDGGLEIKDYVLRHACVDAMATRSLEDLRQRLDELAPDRSAHWRAQLECLRQFDDQYVLEALMEIWPQAKYSGLIATAGDLLFRCLASPNASKDLSSWLSSGDPREKRIASDAICKARCVMCSAKNPGRSMFCGDCYSVTPSALKKGWFRFRDAAAVLRGLGSLDFTEEKLASVFADYFPTRILFDKIEPKKMPVEHMEFDPELGKVLVLLDFGQDYEKLIEFFIPLLLGVKASDLSDEELISWAVSTNGYSQRDSIPGKQQAQVLCSQLDFADELNLVQLAKDTWPNSRNLISKIREFDVFWPSLTLATESAKSLLKDWDSPDLYSFRRALNQNDLELLKSCGSASDSFLDALDQLGLTLPEVKTRVRMYGPALVQVLGLNRNLNPERILAWIAVAPHPIIKLRLLVNPTAEVIQMAADLNSPKPMGPRKFKHDWLHYGDPLTPPPVAQAYVQKSWAKRFWS